MVAYGAIAKKEVYEAGECSYAHLMPDGTIWRFGTQIGTESQIEILGNAADLQPTLSAFINLLDGFANPETWAGCNEQIKKS